MRQGVLSCVLHIFIDKNESKTVATSFEFYNFLTDFIVTLVLRMKNDACKFPELVLREIRVGQKGNSLHSA